MKTQDVKFYLVWTKTGSNPRQSHVTRASAEREAKRLASKNPGKKFFVLEAKQRVFTFEGMTDGN